MIDAKGDLSTGSLEGTFSEAEHTLFPLLAVSSNRDPRCLLRELDGNHDAYEASLLVPTRLGDGLCDGAGFVLRSMVKQSMFVSSRRIWGDAVHHVVMWLHALFAVGRSMQSEKVPHCPL